MALDSTSASGTGTNPTRFASLKTKAKSAREAFGRAVDYVKDNKTKVGLVALTLLFAAGALAGTVVAGIRFHSQIGAGMKLFGNKMSAGWHAHGIGNKLGGCKATKWMKKLNNGTNVAIMTGATGVALFPIATGAYAIHLARHGKSEASKLEAGEGEVRSEDGEELDRSDAEPKPVDAQKVEVEEGEAISHVEVRESEAILYSDSDSGSETDTDADSVI